MKLNIDQHIEDILTDIGCAPQMVEQAAAGIKLYYAQRHRHYHRIEHIKSMLDKADETKWYTPELGFNILFHDIYYKLGSPPGNNEQVSQLMAQQFYAAHCVGSCQLYIHATANFMITQLELSDEAQKLCDLDLSSMAMPSFTLFCHQQDLIGKENRRGPAGTAAFLKSWQESRPEGFYYTAFARKTWEPKAKENVERYIKLYLPKAKKAAAKKTAKPKLVKKKVNKKRKRR